MRKREWEKGKRKDRRAKECFLYAAGAVLCAALFLFAGASLLGQWSDTRKSAKAFAEVAELVRTDTAETVENEDTEVTITPYERYQDIYAQNPDFIGWLTIGGTNIDYPVMQTINEPDFYLKHGFDRSYSDYGVPYLQTNCMAELSDNCVIYGHHMSDGTMFADLCRYADEGFYREHRIIHFDTLSEYGVYEIVSVFKTTAYTDDGFKYYRFVNAESSEDFDSFLETCQMLSLYDTGVSAAYGDRLLTLSTCEYSTQNGRMVVVARKVNAENETAVDDE